MSATLNLQHEVFQSDAAEPAYFERLIPTVLTNRLAPAGHDSEAVDWVGRRWLTRSLAFDAPEDQEPLSLHANWLGPIRLVQSGDRWQRLCEIPFSSAVLGDSWLDPQRRGELASLLDALLTGPLSGNVQPALDGWVPPEAETIVGWLAVLGHRAAVDEEKNLRLTLKCRGSDGQVKIRRDDNRLRLTMRLGQWNGLSPMAEQAMINLAREANSRGRFTRIVWNSSNGQSACEAQVDLSGLPTGLSRDAFWQGVLRAAVLGLGLVLRRLGFELDVLANPKNQDLAERLMVPGYRRKPR